MSAWTEEDIPDLSGRTVLITGANSGLGLRSAQVLAAKGARVVLACRSAERGEAALRTVGAADGKAELVQLDLADLSSVRDTAARIRELSGDRLDVLLNNAGVMNVPRRLTADGFELQFGTNHLGHAALTWLLMPALRGAPGARVVTLSSLAAAAGRVDLDDPDYQRRRYTGPGAYGQAKLANLLFALELDRRLRAADVDVHSVAAHPGYTRTGLSANSARSWGGPQGAALGLLMAIGDRFIAQNVRIGALPQLYAATAPGILGGEYIGPNGFRAIRGYPTRVTPPPQAQDAALAARLWTLTAELTGVDPDPA